MGGWVMRTWMKLATAGVALLAPLAMGAGTAEAATPVAIWHMEATGVMTDSSGHANDGDPQRVTAVADPGFGNGYQFVQNSIVLVPDSPTLDPGTADLSVTTRVRFDKPPSAATGDYDLIRKGLASTAGGEWKIEILPGGGLSSPAFCLFKDAGGKTASVRGRSNLAGGAWHSITCAKTSSQISLTVDGGAPVVLGATLGSISNNQPVGLGQKPGGGDQYIGDMDEVSIEFGGASSGGDTTPPTVTSTNPGADATGASVTGNVTATFSEAVKAVTATNFTLRKAGTTAALGATVSYNASTRTGTLNPAASLAPGTQYTATLTGGTSTGIRDAANNPLATYTWSFTTAGASGGDVTPPTVTAHTPTGTTGISRTANVTATFNEVVTNVTTDTFTLTPEGGGTAVPATVTFNSTSGRWVLNPGSTLLATTTYTATVVGGVNGVKDLAGNPLAADVSWSFTTGA